MVRRRFGKVKKSSLDSRGLFLRTGNNRRFFVEVKKKTNQPAFVLTPDLKKHNCTLKLRNDHELVLSVGPRT